MDRAARRALGTIRRCVDAGSVRVTEHFAARLDERGLFWSDVLTAIEEPTRVRSDGLDSAGRARWVLSGPSTGGTPIGIVCAIGRDRTGVLKVFVTLFWE